MPTHARPSHRPTIITLLTALCLLFVLPEGRAQFGDRLLKAAQRGAERALERKAEQKTGEAVDNTVDEALKKPEGNDGDSGNANEPNTNTTRTTPSEASSESGKQSKNGSTEASNSETGDESTGGDEADVVAFSVTSKFDFEPGVDVSYFDDFSRTSVGDFPSGYNTMGTAEVVTLSTAAGKWLKLGDATEGVDLMSIRDFPENFTFEFDFVAAVPFSKEDNYRYSTYFGVLFTDNGNPETKLGEFTAAGTNVAAFSIMRDHYNNSYHTEFTKRPGSRNYIRGAEMSLVKAGIHEAGSVHKISLWRQGKRLRMYVDQQKVYDMQLGWSMEEPIRAVRFFAKGGSPQDFFYVSNVRMATGKPDTRSKLEKEGKLTTYGITFASGSSDVEASSAGTLKMIAKVLADNPDMKLKITGHTDADGAAEANQSLSEKRAAAVKTILVKDYQIKGDRLSTAGAGESDPIATGDTSSDKARNRRVVLEKV